MHWVKGSKHHPPRTGHKSITETPLDILPAATPFRPILLQHTTPRGCPACDTCFILLVEDRDYRRIPFIPLTAITRCPPELRESEYTWSDTRQRSANEERPVLVKGRRNFKKLTPITASGVPISNSPELICLCRRFSFRKKCGIKEY